jgi:hypothetical protein
MPLNARFCTGCGATLSPPVAAPAAPEPPAKQNTFLIIAGAIGVLLLMCIVSAVTISLVRAALAPFA